MVFDGETYDSVGVRFKGQTSYMNVSGQKKSFNITTDAFIDGQNVKGYNITNLNNCFDGKHKNTSKLYLKKKIQIVENLNFVFFFDSKCHILV